MAAQTLIQAIHDTLHAEMVRDDRVVVLGQDVGARGGVFRATTGLLSDFGPERVIDTPLNESLIAGVAIGMALDDLRPVAEMQFADFIFPAFDQIVSEAAKIRYRSNGDFGVPLVIRAPYGGGVHGALYHSQSVEALFAHIPGLKVVCPSTPADVKGLLLAALDDPDPVLFFEHKKTYRLFKADVPDGDFTVPIGKADVARSGKHLSIFCYGYMRTCALRRLRRWRRTASRRRSSTCDPFDRSTFRQSSSRSSGQGARSWFTRRTDSPDSAPRSPPSSRSRRSTRSTRR